MSPAAGDERASADVVDDARESARETAAPAQAFPEAPRREKGYEKTAVDAFIERARRAFEGTPDAGDEALDADAVRTAAFPLVRRGYAIPAVDAALGRIEDAFAAQKRDRAIGREGAHAWVEQARDSAQVILDRLSRAKGRKFARAGFLRFGYRIDEVDVVSERLRGYFEQGTPVTVEQVRGVAFRMQRRGYREEQVDAVLDAVVDVMLAVR